MEKHTQGNSRVNENHVLQDDLQILKDAILSSSKIPVIAHLNCSFISLVTSF